eukprot:5847348-Prymnesium_polylepis.1
MAQIQCSYNASGPTMAVPARGALSLGHAATAPAGGPGDRPPDQCISPVVAIQAWICGAHRVVSAESRTLLGSDGKTGMA